MGKATGQSGTLAKTKVTAEQKKNYICPSSSENDEFCQKSEGRPRMRARCVLSATAVLLDLHASEKKRQGRVFRGS